METNTQQMVTVQTSVHLPVKKVWELWSLPEHITKWNSASDDWHTPRAENDLRTGGKFFARMEAKDGSFGFDFGGVYDEVIDLELIAYTMGDGRKVVVSFAEKDGTTTVVERFDPEQTHPVEFQQAGWQSILDNFKKYAEQHS